MTQTVRAGVHDGVAGASGEAPRIGKPSAEPFHGPPPRARQTGRRPPVVRRDDGPLLPHATRPVAGYPAGFGR